MKKIVLAGFAVLVGSGLAYAACSTNTDCNSFNIATCVGGVNSPASSGITFSGSCAGGSNATVDSTGATCRLVRCSSNTPIIVAGPPSAAGCSTDGNCRATEVCVSSAGAGACGTGFSQCVPVCFSSTTSTSTTSSSSSTSSSSTSTSSSSTSTTSV